MRQLSALAIPALAVLAVGCGGEDGVAGAQQARDGGTQADASAQRAGGDAVSATASTTVAERRARRRAARRRARRRARLGKPVRVVDSQFGRVIADGKGEAFYLFEKEKGRRSRCYGACARAWPPVLTRARPRAGRGVSQRLLGVTRRRNGRFQVTYAGHPLYYYVDDSPGLILCHNVREFGGLWLVVKPDGRPVA